MKLVVKTPKKSLIPAYQKERMLSEDMNRFKENLRQTLTHIRIARAKGESEENFKNILGDFLKKTYYEPLYVVNTKNREDLVIHTGKTSLEPVGVLFETKKPGSPEMISAEKPNGKAMQQLVLYYLEERITHGNLFLKRLVITDISRWFMFDANWFEENVYRNAGLKKGFAVFKQENKSTKFFYEEVAKPFLDNLEAEVECTYFDLQDYESAVENPDRSDDLSLVALYKIMSPVHLLKTPFANDSNQLDKGFYSELLHIMGLEEVKDGGKKVIRRQASPNEYSMIENTIAKIENKGLGRVRNLSGYGADRSEQVFNIALALCLTWINRLLFLKLLEGQIVAYHRGVQAYRFLNPVQINDYDRLNSLFFEVLAVRPENRKGKVKMEYGRVPYLNSSLFERSELEYDLLEISGLDNGEPMSLAVSTVLKDEKGKKRTGETPTLQYLLEFLEAFDFASEGAESIQDHKRSLVNASVLGLIFEKINGYKDGSFFTPGFITMYMCRETIRRAVVQKFKERGHRVANFSDLLDLNIDRAEANAIVNSLRICDPAVGSGHFLVSALNEIIAVKFDLGVLTYRDGKRVKLYQIAVQNDELVVTDDEGDPFQYAFGEKGAPLEERQKLQEALFHEKQYLIENCLFGVDINPNSVNICRLRLWIELLKNAYYTRDSGFTALETLPNIDINIKCGNSLISKYALNSDLSSVFRQQKFNYKTYLLAVDAYKNARTKEEKEGLIAFIGTIKEEFKKSFRVRDPANVKLAKLRGELVELQSQDLFGDKAIDPVRIAQKEEEIERQERVVQELKDAVVYRNSFEWRFEFPEVLDDRGGFAGFDVAIGNPPYFSLMKIKDATQGFTHYQTYSKGTDIYCLFYERALQILKPEGLLTFITSNSWLRVQYGEALRKLLIEQSNPVLLLNIEDTQVFGEATVESNILTTQKSSWAKGLSAATLSEDFKVSDDMAAYVNRKQMIITELKAEGWIIGGSEEMNLKKKIETHSKPLKDFNVEINYGIKTGFNEAFIIDDAQKEALAAQDSKNLEILKPILRGRDLKKYAYSWEKLWIIFSRRGINIKHYPTIEIHLNQYYDQLKPRTGKETTGRKPGPYKWFELQDNIAYFESFNKEKIIWADLSDRPKFSIDTNGYYINDKCFMMTGEPLRYLLAILNSKLSDWYFNKISTTSGGGTTFWKKYKVELLPIKDIPEPSQRPIVALVDQILAAKQNDHLADTGPLEREIDALVYALYGLTEADIQIIEGAPKTSPLKAVD